MTVSSLKLLPLVLVVLLAAACGDNDKSTAAPPPTTTSSGPGPTGYGPRTGKNTLIMSSRDLYPLLGGSLSGFAPTQVNGYSTRVIALAGRASFWAGRSKRQRILVKLRLKGGKAPMIHVGQKADFVGQMILSSSTSAKDLGLRNDADKLLLQTQGVYVDASAADVKLR